REQFGQPLQVDHLVGDLEPVPEALELRQPHVDGHLPTLERRRDLLAGLRPLGTAPRRLALRALAAPDPGLGGLGTRRRAQVVDLDRHYSTSSTFTRWTTVWIMPRISGRSSFTTTSLIRLRPSERSVSRWFCFDPIPDRVWVTFKRATSSRPRTRAGREHGGRRDVLDRQAAARRHRLRRLQALQRRHRRVHDVDRVGRPEALGQHVVDAGTLQYRAHRSAGDDTGTGAGGLEQHHAGGVLTRYRVRDGRPDPGHLEEVLL